MSNFLSRYSTDSTLETEGVWVDFGDGIQVKVTRENTDEAQKYRQKILHKYRTHRKIPDEVLTDLATKVLAHVLVKDWKGITDEKGKDLPYTPENAYKIFSEFKDFREDVSTASQEREFFKQEEIAAQAKN